MPPDVRGSFAAASTRSECRTRWSYISARLHKWRHRAHGHEPRAGRHKRGTTSGTPSAAAREGGMGPLREVGLTTAPIQEPNAPDVVVWRYSDMCRHWGVSRATIERWVRRYEETGEGIPVHRDPSGRPYWLAHEASGAANPSVRGDRIRVPDSDRLERLRRASRRGRRTA